MSQELIYTSSPKGLKLGARGFCTVASTDGLTKILADRLESLSGYRHLHPPGSSEAHLNPVNYSYLRFALGGQSYYVLSRIADSGLDYTQRTNKLAHHIALLQKELPSAGPAWLAGQTSFFASTWKGEPQQLPANGRPIPQGHSVATVCSAWRAVTGDAGWAGMLANQIANRVSGEAYLIFTPGTDLLELFEEAQSLLSVEQRWEATFSTFFTTLPPGIGCRWRGVVDGSAEATRARRTNGLLVIDLARPLGRAPELPLVATARCGAEATPNVGQRRAAKFDAGFKGSEIPRFAAETYRIPEHPIAYAPQLSGVNSPPKLPVRANAESTIPRKNRRRLATFGLLVLAMSLGAVVSAGVLHYFHTRSIETTSLAGESLAKQRDESDQKPQIDQIESPSSKNQPANAVASSNPAMVDGTRPTATIVKNAEIENEHDADKKVRSEINNPDSVMPIPAPEDSGTKPSNTGISTTEPELKTLNGVAPVPDNIFDGMKSEIQLPDVLAPNITIAGDKWLEPIEIGRFPLADPQLTFLLVGVDDKVLTRGRFDRGHATLNIDGNDLAKLQIRSESASLNFLWSQTAQGSPKDQIEKVRTAVLVLISPTTGSENKSKAILLSPAKRDKALKLTKSLDGTSFQLPQSLSPADATLKCRFQSKSGLNESIETISPLDTENSISTTFGPDASLSLEVSCVEKNEKRFVVFDVEAADSHGRKSPLGQTLKSQKRRRRDILVDAIVEYVKGTPLRWRAWEAEGVPMSKVTNGIVAGQTQTNTSLIFDLDAENRLRGKIKHEFTTLASLSQAEEKFRNKAGCGRSADLSAHEKEYPHLYDWSEIDSETALRVEANVQIVRHVRLPDSDHHVDVILMECGTL